MGHRALVTYLHEPFPATDSELAQLRGTTYYSHWGASNLKVYHRITPSDPHPDCIDEDPAIEGETVEEVVNDHLDFLHHEAYFIVDANYDVRVFRTLWYELSDLQSHLLGPVGAHTTRMPEDGWRTVGFGALAEPRILEGYDEDGSDHICDHENGRFRGAKSILQDTAIRFDISEADALEQLNEWVHEQWSSREPRRIPEFSPFGYWRNETPPEPAVVIEEDSTP